MEHGNGTGTDVSTFVQRGQAAQNAIDAEIERENELAERLELRCTAADLERWRDAARARGVSVSAFVRMAGRELALEPAIAQGALYGVALELGKHAVEALQRSVAELANLGDQLQRVAARLESLPNVQEIAQQLRAGGEAPRKVAKKKARKQKLAMPHANRQKPPARKGKR